MPQPIAADPKWTARLVLPLTGLTALAIMAFLFGADRAIYHQILADLMINPFREPFIDAQQIPAVTACWRQGINVFVTAPCDPLHRVMAYSPLWLHIPFMPAWSIWIGVGLAAAFYLSLALLPAMPRGRLMVMVCALLSGMPAFAVERGNMDLVMFVLVAIGGWCATRSQPVRLAGYGAITLAGLLKFYPLTLFLLFLRERPARFIALCAAGGAILVGFVWIFHAQLAEMARNLPDAGPFTDAFGARQLSDGILPMSQWLLNAVGIHGKFVTDLPHKHAIASVLHVLLAPAAIWLSARLANRPALKSSLASLREDEKIFLLIGTTLICSCFFASLNVGYRGIHLLFALPGLMALAAIPATRRLLRATTGAVIFLMWGLSLQKLVATLCGGTAYPIGGGTAIYLFWFGRELVWWGVIVVFLAIIFAAVGEAPALKYMGRKSTSFFEKKEAKKL